MYTNWNENIKLQIKLKTIKEHEQQSKMFTEDKQTALQQKNCRT